jgi:cation diffusion facilitator family transporter
LSEQNRFTFPHEHNFLSENHHVNERRTWFVIALTATTMVVEILSGLLFGSMALLADGWHMASHASAMGITAMAFYWARKHLDNPRFTFGTGKIGDLAGYSSALLLALIAFFMAYESIRRLLNPVIIHFNEAILVAIIGLTVNLVSAFILKEDHHKHERHHSDHNLRAAYLHVLADSLTSILAIVALLFGKFRGWTFLDPVMGVVGALVISRWSYGLMRDTGRVLLDYNDNVLITRQIKEALRDEEKVNIEDLHVWRVGPGHYSSTISLRTEKNHHTEYYKNRLCHIPDLAHVTIEVNQGDHNTTNGLKEHKGEIDT